ncbi:MAG: FAD-dependent oxidoreductase [Chloroflexi bacterium]|nr:FAD-dependent oxidoreductase [Chloroflexota bacterium]
MAEYETIHEPARETPVMRRCDVLVVGGGPAGCAAASSSAAVGADTVLVERYGHLGGMSTGGFVIWIDRMTDWDGNQVISGYARDLIDLVPKDAILGPPDDLWGSRDSRVVDYWQERHNAYQGTVTWSPTIDPEMLKIAYMELALERGVKLILHAWGVEAVREGNEMRGVIFESKSGRQAILADVVVDATGDGDIFALAKAPFEMDAFDPSKDPDGADFVIPATIHDRMNISCRWGGVDMERYREFKRNQADDHRAIMSRGTKMGVPDRPHMMPRDDMTLFMAPKFSGYSPLNVEDLTTVEIEGRRRMMVMLDFYRKNVPGFERAWVMDTSPQIGTRHSRRLKGAKRMVSEEWKAGKIQEDEVGVSPSPNRRFPNVSLPLGCLIPESLDNMLAAGRNLSSDPASHSFMREIPQCWLMGQAAGVAAAVAVGNGVNVRNVGVAEVRDLLSKQGVYLNAG